MPTVKITNGQRNELLAKLAAEFSIRNNTDAAYKLAACANVNEREELDLRRTKLATFPMSELEFARREADYINAFKDQDYLKIAELDQRHHFDNDPIFTPAMTIQTLTRYKTAGEASGVLNKTAAATNRTFKDVLIEVGFDETKAAELAEMSISKVSVARILADA